MKNASDPIRNQTCDLLACRTVPKPTVPPHTATYQIYIYRKHRRETGVRFAAITP
jgi:hypothetical protein